MAMFGQEGSGGQDEAHRFVSRRSSPPNRGAGTSGRRDRDGLGSRLLSDCFEIAEIGLSGQPKNRSPGNRFSFAISGASKMVGATGIEPVTPTMST